MCKIFYYLNWLILQCWNIKDKIVKVYFYWNIKIIAINFNKILTLKFLQLKLVGCILYFKSNFDILVLTYSNLYPYLDYQIHKSGSQ